MVTAGNAKQTGDVSTPLVVYKSWEADREPLSEDDAAEIRKQIELAAEQRKKQEQASRRAAAEQAWKRWDRAQEAANGHPYLAAKGVQAHGLRRHGDHLLVPVADAGGNLHGLQHIGLDGTKRFNPGAAVGGHFHLIGRPNGLIYLAEGYATAATIHEATGAAVAVAFNAGNLEAVARVLTEAYPDAVIAVCADDDYRTDGNPGISKATAAARAVGGKLVIPDFGPERPEGATDFNDMARHLGLEAVREAIINQAGVSGVSVAEAQTRANTDVHPDTCDTHQKDVAYQTAPDPTGEPISHDGTSSSRISGVSGVSGVQPNNDAGSSDTPTGGDGVSGVSGTRESPIPDPSDRPTFRVLDDWTEHNGAKYRPGVWYFATDKDGEPVQTWVCSPLHVEAVTFDAQDNNFGRLLRFKTTLGRWREWAMPMELLSGLGNEVRSELLAMGVEIDPSTKARNLLSTYLQSRAPKRRMRCALQIGWCDGSFVLPDTVIGPAASGVIFQSGERGHDEHTVAGILDGWRSEIAARAVGNPLSTLGLSSGFTGPMLARTNSEGGGIHFVGESSTGKTTIIEAACSIWGGPNYRRSWRATANGMEGAAALFNDGLLAVDEISECSPKEVGAIVCTWKRTRQAAGEPHRRCTGRCALAVLHPVQRRANHRHSHARRRATCQGGTNCAVAGHPCGACLWRMGYVARCGERRGILGCDQARIGHAPRACRSSVSGAADPRSARLLRVARGVQGAAGFPRRPRRRSG
jgi:putative DNA primase/helicase